MPGGWGPTTATNVIKLLFNGTPIANIADNAASGPLTSLYLALHTASPSGGNQSTSEATYPGYTRVAVVRTASGFTAASAAVALVANTSFPASTGGSETEQYFSVGTASTGAGAIFFWGTISPNIQVSASVTPVLNTGSMVQLQT